MTGTYNWHQQKYYQWCVGGNGGLTRQPAMKAHQWERDAIKMGYFTIDITPRENDEEFFVGRLNYEKMQAEAGAAPQAVSPAVVIGRPADVSGPPVAHAFALSKQLEEALSRTQAELKQVPALIRPMAAGSFKSKAGCSVRDWLETAEALSAALSDQDADAVTRVKDELPDLRESLVRLQTYYHEAPAEGARNIRDEETRREMAEQMAQREAVVGALISALDEISSSKGGKEMKKTEHHQMYINGRKAAGPSTTRPATVDSLSRPSRK
jgi:hypothetical protein